MRQSFGNGLHDITRSDIEKEIVSRGLYKATKTPRRKYTDLECIKMAVDDALAFYGLTGKRGPVAPGKWNSIVNYAYDRALRCAKETEEKWPSGLIL